ncbi:MAG TPA: DMT family transporter [Terriglobia bacterium]|nr:DMT family transporter [Terriglobia bacterium]
MSLRVKAELMLAAICIIWGTSFLVVKDALAYASPLAFIAIRFTLAGVTSAMVLRTGIRLLTWDVLRAGLVLGLCLLGGFVLQVSGLLWTTPSKSAFITAFSVVLVPVMLALGGAPLPRSSAIAALAGFSGLYVLLAPSRTAGINRGDLLTLGGSVSFALYIVFVGRYAGRFDFRALVPAQLLVVGLGAALALPLDGHARVEWTPRFVAALAMTAFLATVLAFSVQNWAQQYTPPAHAALILSLEPVFAAAASRLVMGEHLGARFIAGSVLMLSGILISEVWGGRPAPIEV